MNKPPILLILVLLCWITDKSFSQEVPDVMPPSPTATQFLRYGDIPVSKYTGVPNINIPIYTVQSAGFSLPINLTYHASGIKVNDEASWVGLGWSLNPEGNIVQIVNGYDDFGPYKNRVLPDVDEIIRVSSSGAPSGVLDNCTGAVTTLSTSKFNIPTTTGVCPDPGGRSDAVPYELFNPIGTVPKDFEPDVFKFNVLGYSGTFVLDWETESFVCISDAKITIVGNSSQFNEIKIVLPNGIECDFSVKEETIVRGSNIPYATDEYNDFLRMRSSRVYKLDEIRMFGDVVEFEYLITSPIKNFLEFSRSKTSYITSQNSPSNLGLAGLTPQSNGSFMASEQKQSYLTKIKFNKGVVLFDLSNRVDLVGGKKLDRIRIKESESSPINIKSFDFQYDYFIGHTGGTYMDDTFWDLNGNTISNNSFKNLQERTHRLKLLSLNEENKPAHTFSYNSTQLPQKTSTAQDYWGYYNGHLSNIDLWPNLRRFNYENEISFLNRPLNNRSSNGSYVKAGILEGITYPTGGSTKFHYELNTFNNHIVPNYNDNENSVYSSNHKSYGSGLRVVKIENFSSPSELVSQKVYSYGEGKIMSPLNLVNRTFIRIDFSVMDYGQSAFGFRSVERTSSFGSTSFSSTGNNVGYDFVDEFTVSNNISEFNPSDFANPNHIHKTNGKTTYKFENHANQNTYFIGQGKSLISDDDFRGNGQFAELGIPTMDRSLPANGSLKEKIIYDNQGRKVMETINKYNTIINYQCFNGLKVGPRIDKLFCAGSWSGPTAWNETFIFFAYPIRGVYTNLSHTETVEYFQGSEFSTESELRYNSLNQLTQKKTLTSNDDNIVETFEPNGKCPIAFKGYKKEYNGNIQANKSYTFLGCSKVKEDYDLITGRRMQYDYSGTPSNLSGYALNNGKEKTRILWDYYGKYPLVQFRYNRSESIQSSWIDELVSASQGFDTPQLRDALDLFRSRLNGRGIYDVTTMTYQNLVGLSSITDPSGKTTYYHYDDFYRLAYVTDHEGNRIKEYNYNFKL